MRTSVPLFMGFSAVVFAACAGPSTAPPRATLPPVVAAASPENSAAGAIASPPREHHWVELEASPGAPELEPGAAAIKKSWWRTAKTALEPAVEKIRGTAPLDAVLAGKALLGRACSEMHDTAGAESAYAEVLAVWDQSDATGSHGDASDRAILAVSEALFFVAEEKRSAAEKLEMPIPQAGDAEPGAQETFVAGRVSQWLGLREGFTGQAAAAYARIAAIDPNPPTRWAVDAAARTGIMWGRFMSECKCSTLPTEWLATGKHWSELRRNYYSLVDQLCSPLKNRMRPELLKCVSLAEKNGYEDSLSKECVGTLDLIR